MMRQIVHLVIGTLAIWLALAPVAWLIGGEHALLETAVACALCAAPMAGTMLWCHFAFGGSPEQQLAAVLGGTGVRLLVAVGGGIALSNSVETLSQASFLIWVIVFYLATLTLEVVLIVRRQNGLAGALAAPTEQPRP